MLATEKAAEWNTHLWIAGVDFKQAFDCVEHFAIWDALRALGVPEQYDVVLAALYQGQTGVVCEDRDSRQFEIGRGTKQGDPVSPKIFNAVLEVVFRRLKGR